MRVAPVSPAAADATAETASPPVGTKPQAAARADSGCAGEPNPSGPPTTLIRVTNLEKAYATGDARADALCGVSFSSSPGESLAIVGPSGSGKSTLLSILAGLLVPSAGEVEVCGVAVEESSVRERAHLRATAVSCIDTTDNLIAVLSGYENVFLAARLNADSPAEAHRRTQEAIDAVEARAVQKKLPATMSHGERARIAVAQALAKHPKLILADEPTAHLDSKSGDRVLGALLAQAKARSVGVVIATHRDADLRHIDRVLRLHDGRLVEAAQR